MLARLECGRALGNGAVHQAPVFVAIIGRCAVQQAAIVPHQHIADAPLVIVDEAVLGAPSLQFLN